MRGEVSPGDLFTTFPTSRARIEGSARIFSGEYRVGRAENTLELRPEAAQTNESINNVNADDKLEYMGADAEIHDQHALPHHYTPEEVE